MSKYSLYGILFLTLFGIILISVAIVNRPNSVTVAFQKEVCSRQPQNSTQLIGTGSTHPQYNCYTRLALDTDNVTICHAIETSPEFPSTGDCYQEFAIEKNDSSYCEQIEIKNDDAGAQSSCFTVLATKNEDTTFCNRITPLSGINSRDSCLSELAFASENPEICESLDAKNGTVSRNTCLHRIAAATDNVNLCARKTLVSGDFTQSRDGCYAIFAVWKKDPTLCDRVVDPQEREKCLQKLR